MKGFAQNLLKVSHALNVFEWMVVLGVALIPVIAVQFIAMFYIGLAVLSIMIFFVSFAVWDYRRTKTKKQREKKAGHYSLVAIYILASSILSISYLVG